MMIHWNKFVVSSILLVMLSTLGCIKKRVDTSGFQPFEDKSYDNVLCLVIDLSGSFVDDWQNDSKAHQMFVSVMDDFFNDSMGEESRIVVSQISAQVPYVIFDGTPKDFVQQFPNPEELNRFLIENSNPDRSEVYLSIDKTLSYINQIDGIGPDTRTLTLVFSDLMDSGLSIKPGSELRQKITDQLSLYAEARGTIAFYFVDEHEKPLWSELLQNNGFDRTTSYIAGQLDRSPQLPSFD